MTPAIVLKHERRTERLLLTLLAAVAALVFCHGITLGGLRWYDDAVHAMDGVLIHDWVRAGPPAWADPVDFAIKQYAHYPTIGLVGVYPPGFAIVESVFYAVFGVSVFTARLCVASFGVAAAIGCYLLMRRMSTRGAAMLATACLVGMPICVTWTRQVMLEMPTMAVLVWLCYAATRLVGRPSWPRVVLVASLALAAPLFKQSALIMLAVAGMVTLFLWWKGRLPTTKVVGLALLVCVPLGGYYGWALLAQGSSTHMGREIVNYRGWWEFVSWSSLTYYARTLPQQASWLVLGLAAVGCGFSLRIRDWRWMTAMLAFVGMYTIGSLVQHKDARFLFPAYLPIAMWAGLGGAGLLALLRSPRVRGAVCAATLAIVLAAGWRTPIQRGPDYARVLEQYESRMRGAFMLIEAHRDGDFVFAARSLLGPRGCVAVRGSKVLYSCAVYPGWEYAAHVESSKDVSAVIDRYAFDLIFVERGNADGLPEVEFLNTELARADHYELLGSHEMTVPGRGLSERKITIDVFRPLQVARRRLRQIEIPIPIVGRTVLVDYSTTGAP